ncbi:reverse transcriptase domain-containing protein [Tanacetum coccineum]
MESQVIEETVSKDQRNPPGTTIEDRKTKTCSPHIEGQTTTCSPICSKAQEKFLLHKEPQKASNHLPRCSEANDNEIPPRQLSHLVKGIKKEKEKSTDTPQGVGKKDKSTVPVEAPILMISREDYAAKNTISESMAYKEEIMFPPVTRRKHMRGKRSVGEVSLKITIGEHPHPRTETLNFAIVKSDSPHNMLFGRTAMQKMGIVVSIIHEAIKFHTKKGVETVLSVGEAGEETKKARRTLTISKERIPSYDDTEEKIFVNDKYLKQMVTIGKHDRNSENHHGPDRNTSAYKEAEEVTKVGILQKVKHQTWVANPVMVKKNDGGWRMCVNFTDINKACPKDCYPLPEIDWKIESLTGFHLKCFLDAYKGYHQIQMVEGDEDKTTFFVGEGVFCYRKMPFGLKNERATYQRLVDKVFSKQIGRNLEAYVDDLVIKSTSEEGILSDIQETFERFWSINMKLNLKKCSFGVEEGLFLGHLITKQGIKFNPTKIKEFTVLEQTRSLKDIQSLNGKLAALSHFLSKGAERSLPFFKVLKRCKGKKTIHWTDEADKAFKEIKKFVQDLPTLTAPRAGETLTMYLNASKESINVMLFAKRSEGKILIYFVSRVLQGAELNYPALEKLILALVHAPRRLRRYFQAYMIMVPTGTPIKQALTGPKKTGRVAKWAIKLGEHDIIFLKRDEREMPADFLLEIPFDDSEKKVKEKEVSNPSNEWKLYTDRASSLAGTGAGLMLIDPAGKEYTYALCFEFETTNNDAEYEALLA